MFVIRSLIPFLAIGTSFSVCFGELPAQALELLSQKQKTLNVLFVGNSYTARHNLALVVKSMAEASDPNLTFNPTSVIYGGRTLADHWRLGTQNFVRINSLTRAEEQATIKSLELLNKNPKDRYAGAALRRHRILLEELREKKPAWDVIVLQSYRDDLEGENSLYMQFAPKFAELAKSQGAQVILYETTPTTQNAEPLTARPETAKVIEKVQAMAALAHRIDAQVVPMSLVGLRCQSERPDLTLRFVNDAHLNQTMAYMTACTLYSALFERSPEGLPINSVTDIRFFNDKNRTKDRDGKPIKKDFSDKDRADLQRIAWQGYTEFKKIRLSQSEERP